MYDMMKKQNYGVEIELTGITREKAAKVISEYFGTTPGYIRQMQIGRCLQGLDESGYQR